jgi:hypothetical protein
VARRGRGGAHRLHVHGIRSPVRSADRARHHPRFGSDADRDPVADDVHREAADADASGLDESELDGGGVAPAVGRAAAVAIRDARRPRGDHRRRVVDVEY